jgi:flagellar hook-associated protein FlgK
VHTDFEDWTIDSMGALRDADGNKVFLNVSVDTSADKAVTAADLARRYDRTAPAKIENYLAGGSLVRQTDKPNDTGYPIGDFVIVDKDGGVTAAPAFDQWSIDSDGYLVVPGLDADGNDVMLRVSHKLDPNTKIKALDLVQQYTPKLLPGENTPNDLLPGEKANGNLDQMKIALNDKSRIFPNGFKGNFQEYMIGFQEDMANDKQTNDSLLSGSTNVLNGLADSRDAISSVSVDEEAITMMTYQNYYNAASRYMTTLDEALDKIINGMGTVGR